LPADGCSAADMVGGAGDGLILTADCTFDSNVGRSTSCRWKVRRRHGDCEPRLGCSVPAPNSAGPFKRVYNTSLSASLVAGNIKCVWVQASHRQKTIKEQ